MSVPTSGAQCPPGGRLTPRSGGAPGLTRSVQPMAPDLAALAPPQRGLGPLPFAESESLDFRGADQAGCSGLRPRATLPGMGVSRWPLVG
jgi:hypothetical protein